MVGTIGEIRGFGGNFAPRNWAFCQGQLLSIAQNQALFSILGTTYGGDGRTTFALPDLRGRIPISAGTGPGLSTHKLGARSGQEVHTVTSLEMASHFHSAITGTMAAYPSFSKDPADHDIPGPGDVPAVANFGSGISAQNVKGYGGATTPVGGAAIPVSGSVILGPTGGSQWHNNMAPYLTIYWVICMFGTFPSRS